MLQLSNNICLNTYFTNSLQAEKNLSFISEKITNFTSDSNYDAHLMPNKTMAQFMLDDIKFFLLNQGDKYFSKKAFAFFLLQFIL